MSCFSSGCLFLFYGVFPLRASIVDRKALCFTCLYSASNLFTPSFLLSLCLCLCLCVSASATLTLTRFHSYPPIFPLTHTHTHTHGLIHYSLDISFQLLRFHSARHVNLCVEGETVDATESSSNVPVHHQGCECECMWRVDVQTYLCVLVFMQFVLVSAREYL